MDIFGRPVCGRIGYVDAGFSHGVYGSDVQGSLICLTSWYCVGFHIPLRVKGFIMDLDNMCAVLIYICMLYYAARQVPIMYICNGSSDLA